MTVDRGDHAEGSVELGNEVQPRSWGERGVRITKRDTGARSA
ncbi:MAG: hypothetical protein ACYCTL_13440 [Acidimicrobiales bacterium]